MDGRYDTHCDQVPLSDPETDPKKLSLYWRTDVNVKSVISDKMQLTLDIRNLFDRKNETGAVWGNRNRKGHEEEGLRYTQ